MPELYRFTCDSLDCNPQLIYGENIIISAEGSQQGDPLSILQFCESIQSTLTEREARTKLGFVDDIDLEREVACVARDVQVIMDSQPLFLNAHKCEITARNFDIINIFPIFNQFKRVLLEDMTLLGAPIIAGRTVDAALKEKTAILKKSIKRLSLLPSH